MDNYENLSREQLIDKLGELNTRIAQLELSYSELIRKSQGYLEGYSHYLETLSRLPVGIFLTDQAGNYVYVNQTWCKLTGINYGGAMFANWMHAIAPWQRNQVINEWRHALKEKAPYYAQFELVRPDKTSVWVSAAAHWITFDNDAFPGYLGTITDITSEIKFRSDIEAVYARLKAILSSLQAGILVEDENRRIVFINDALVNMFGIPVPPEMMIGTDCSNSAEDLKHLLLNPVEFIRRIEELLAARKEAISDQLNFVDGRIYERDYLPVFINESYRGHLWQYRDVTQQVNASRKLEQYAGELKASNEGKDKFLSILSHDLKNSFTSIVGFSDFLVNGIDHLTPNDISNYANTINRSSHSVYNLLANLLEWGKLQFGKMPYNPKSFMLYLFLEEVSVMFSVQASLKNLTIRIEASPDDVIFSDRQMLFSVVQNLIINAIKFSTEGKEIVLRGAVLADKTILQVVDGGIGIPADIKDNLFKLDKIGTRDGTNNEKGSGLGLLIAAELMQKMGGTIEIESEPGKGSTFSLILPNGKAEN